MDNFRATELWTPEKIRNQVQSYIYTDVDLHAGAVRGNFQKACKAMVDSLRNAGADIPENPRYARMLVWSYLALDAADKFEIAATSKMFSNGFLLGISRWQFEPVGNTEQYRQRPTFMRELEWVHWRAMQDLERQKEYGDMCLGDLLALWQGESPYSGDEIGYTKSLQDFLFDMAETVPEQDKQWNELTKAEKEKEAIEDYPGLPEGAVWCEWCGDVITAPGIPCDQCKRLGAPQEAREGYGNEPRNEYGEIFDF